jgi:hypothetical protein
VISPAVLVVAYKFGCKWANVLKKRKVGWLDRKWKACGDEFADKDVDEIMSGDTISAAVHLLSSECTNSQRKKQELKSPLEVGMGRRPAGNRCSSVGIGLCEGS